MLIKLNAICTALYVKAGAAVLLSGAGAPDMLLLIGGIVLIAAGLVLIFLSVFGFKKDGPALKFSQKKNVPVQEYKPESPQTAASRLMVNAESLIGDRPYQQDYCRFASGLSPELQAEKGTLCIVCDGMGGLQGGERASRLCCETVFNGYYDSPATEDVCSLLKQLIISADKGVARLTGDDGQPINGGTTIVAVVIRGEKAYWASAGDSRIYLYLNGNLSQITQDHNYRMILMQDVKAGKIPPEAVEQHPQKEALISYVGKGNISLIDTGEFKFAPGDGTLILCSDGLYKYANPSQITGIAGQYASQPDQTASALAYFAAGNLNVRHDNITVMTACRQ